MPRALITGITGQSGSFLAELLLDKGYEVFGVKRRVSVDNLGRISHILSQIKLVDGDLLDAGSINRAVKDTRPDEVYNLAAQSFVGTSFDQPEVTGEVTGLGVTRVLEALRMFAPEARFYQASSSEMFGHMPPPHSEKTRFYPRSPYGCAKVYGYWMTVNYREAYDLFACNGLLYNHETIAGFMPMIFKCSEDGEVDIKPISEIVRHHASNDLIVDESIPEYQEGEVKKDLFVWDAEGWTKVKFASGYKHKGDKAPRIINARGACFMATDTHVAIMDGGEEKEIRDVGLKDQVNLIDLPVPNTCSYALTPEEAEFLGYIVGDGCISSGKFRFINKSYDRHAKVKDLWESIGGESTRMSMCKSGFNGDDIPHLWMKGRKDLVKRSYIYNEDKTKRVPKAILNGDEVVQKAFLRGYYAADGLKAGCPAAFEFRSFKTNSATLAMGIIYLIHQVTGQEYNITVEEQKKEGKRYLYYAVNFLSDSKMGQNSRNLIKKAEEVRELVTVGVSQRGIERQGIASRGFIRKVQNGYSPDGHHHWQKSRNEVKKIIDYPEYDGWFYDLETESGTFHCGIGRGHVHNSPRRGKEFVTQKIARAAAAIKAGVKDVVKLGNLDAARDWGHARDYVRAMWMMLQYDKPDDYVVATGESHSVREFVAAAFQYVGLDWEKYVEIDPRFFRPTEVNYLRGDCSKIKEVLGWEPSVSFSELVEEMVQHAMDHPEEWENEEE